MNEVVSDGRLHAGDVTFAGGVFEKYQVALSCRLSPTVGKLDLQVA
ncbi:MAG: hypothetical protein PVG24_08295 [Gammaproteobacteria bacterium]|jgi:hypothetical protein